MVFKWHRWLATLSAGFFLIWLLTGIVMTLPRVPNPNLGQSSKVITDYSTATVSPSQALKKLEATIGEISQVGDIQLYKILDLVVYQIVLNNGQSYLMNAQSGEQMTIDAEVSAQIARSHGPNNSHVVNTEYLTDHTEGYSWGPLPVYRVLFDDKEKTMVYVSVTNGVIAQSHQFQRIRGMFETWHDFGPLQSFGQGGRVRKIVLLLTSLVGVGVVCTGIFIFVKQLRK